MTGQTRYHAGRVAEDIVARHYADRSYVLEAKRWRSDAGEIDLIMRQGAQVIFVEVKKSARFAQAAHRLRPRQMQRLLAAGAAFLANEPLGQLTDVRFDLALVDGQGQVEVIGNAFQDG